MTLPGELAPEGFHNGTITTGWLDAEEGSEESLRVCFEVALDEGPSVECRHRAFGDKADKTRAVVEHLGMTPWPYGLENIAEVAPGKRVRVWIVHNPSKDGRTTYANGYIVLGGKRSGDSKAVRPQLHALAKRDGVTIERREDEDDLPF